MGKILKIRKRDGKLVRFDQDKITEAIRKAAQAVGGVDEKVSKKTSDKVVETLEKEFNLSRVPSVEDVQDIVERILIEEGHVKTAKGYILYRQERAKIRANARQILNGKFTRMYKTLSLNSLRILAGRYLLRDLDGNVVESPEEMFERVARGLAEVEREYGKDDKEIEKFYNDFYNVLFNLEFLPAGRTLANVGGSTRLVSNCIVLHFEDSMRGIFDTLRDASLLQQAGSGLGFPFHLLRPAGTPAVRSRGVASGPVSFLRVYNQAFGVIKQQGRHGANMAVMSVGHPDILEFIHCKEKEGDIRNFNISVGVTDDFMKAFVEDDPNPWICEWRGEEVKPRRIERDAHDVVVRTKEENMTARQLMDEIVTAAWSNGEPGIIFLDVVNKHNPIPGLGRIEACNPCISGDSMIPTEYGLLPMQTITNNFPEGNIDVITDSRVIENQNGNIKLKTLGTSLNKISRSWLSGRKQTYKLITKAGFELIATSDHKIMTNDGWIPLSDLASSDHKVLIQSGGTFSKINRLPFDIKIFENVGKKKLNLPNEWSLGLGQIIGWLVGDGWIRDGVHLCFAPEDESVKEILKPIIENFYKGSVKETVRKNDMKYLNYQANAFTAFFKLLGVKQTRAKNKEVPKSIFIAPKEAVKGFVQGLFSSDGSINFTDEKASNIRLSSSSEKMLKQVQLLLLNFGIFSKVYDRPRDNSKPKFFYIAKNGDKREYYIKDCYYDLVISKDDVPRFLDQIGFIGNKNENNGKIKKLLSKTYYQSYFEDSVKSIKSYEVIDVFDLTEPVTHSFVANGIVVSNCGEQFLHDGDVCNLGSINLDKFVKDGKIDWDKLKLVIRTAVRMLDNVIDLTDFPVDKVNKVFRSNRRIGLGVMGFADLLLRLKIPYNSKNGILTAESIMRFIEETAVKMSQELAEEKGVFPNWEISIWKQKGMRMRNAALTCVAPTGSISMICDVSSGIEPYFALVYEKSQIMGGQTLYYINKHLEHELKRKGVYSEETMRKISKTGSVQDITEVPKDLKDIFVVALDISPEDHVKMQAAFQKFTDNSISKTCNFPSDATKEDVMKTYILAWQLGCRGLTVYRSSSRQIEVLHLVKDEQQKESENGNGQIATPIPVIINENENDKCPDCGTNTLHKEGGCIKCSNCGLALCSI